MFTRETNYDKATGTYLVGSIKTTKAKLVKVFGKPDTELSESKIRNHWLLTFTRDDGTKHIVTIYDWKVYRDLGWEETYDWHIGGNDKSVVEDVFGALGA